MKTLSGKGCAAAMVPPLAKATPSALTARQLRGALCSLKHWRLETNLVRGDAGRLQTELTRQFAFSSFAEAVQFMARSVPDIDARDHHPRWQNVYDQVSVWLTTHDAGAQVTARDVALARFLEASYQRFRKDRLTGSPATVLAEYLEAYNAMDVGAMLKTFAANCVFESFNGGRLTVRTKGKAQLKALATRSAKAFLSREQRVVSLTETTDQVAAEIDYRAVLQADLSPELRAGSQIRLRGVTVAEFRDGKIVRLSDYA